MSDRQRSHRLTTDTKSEGITSWDSSPPTTLVIACSDGRIHGDLGAFLRNDLHIERYDRLYVPGGAGALAPSGIEFTRAHRFQRECRFLIEAHQLDTVILLFHGPAPEGPSHAQCGDYRRKFPKASASDIRQIQDRDLADILRLTLWHNLRVVLVRQEITREGHVRFHTLHDSAEPTQ